MKYYIDLTTISFNDYKKMLKSHPLIPSWRLILEDIDSKFNTLSSLGFKDIGSLLSVIKNKKKLADLSEKSMIPIQYLTVLKREIASHLPPQRKLSEYPTISDSAKKALEDLGIKTSKNFYDWTDEHASRADTIKISSDEMTHIKKLVNVTRLRYVSPLFATLLVMAGYDSVKKISQSDLETFYEKMGQTNMNNKYFKGKLGKSDYNFVIHDAVWFIDNE